MKKHLQYTILLSLLLFSTVAKAQSVVTFNPGVFLNAGGFDRDVFGGGAILGIEYAPTKDHIFSIELRNRLGGYGFDAKYKEKRDDDNNIFPFPSNSTKDYAIDYSLFNAQIGLVPKLNLYLDDEFWLFLENEFAIGLFTSNIKYLMGNEYRKKRVTDYIMSYNISVGIGGYVGQVPFSVSIGYSTLNFRGNIRRHSPKNFTERIPDQNAAILLNIACKIPIKKNNK